MSSTTTSNTKESGTRNQNTSPVLIRAARPVDSTIPHNSAIERVTGWLNDRIDRSLALVGPRAARRGERRALIGVDAFLGITGVAGGIALLTQTIAPPVELLRFSLFSNYEVPGLALTVIVGGGGLLAAATTLTRRSIGRLISLLAGLGIISFEVVEMIAVAEGSWLQYFYLAVGVIILALAVRQPGNEAELT